MKTLTIVATTIVAAILTSGCQTSSSETKTMTVSAAPFGKTKSGKPITLYALRNGNGMEVDIMNYGATVTAIRVPDRDGNIENVTLGYKTLAGYEKGTSFFGSIVGRYGNRIAKGRFTLDGKTYQLPTNNGPNSLHGGDVGFNQRVWSSEPVALPDAVGVKFTYVSPDGEQGYPGTMTTVVTYSINNKNELVIDYSITTDAPTVANVTNHAYFNLRGEGDGDILGHEMQIFADAYTPTDDTLIPTGEVASVDGTPMDFRKATPVGERIDQKFPALVAGGGYDHNYVANGSGMRKIVKVYEPDSGRVMEVYTDEPAVQFYSGNFLDDEPGIHVYPYRSGFCLETQHYPDSPNHPNFPNTVLRPGETYESETIYKFSTR